MHRALLIEVGKTFEPSFDRLKAKLTARVRSGHVSFVDAPMVGDGNLSRPVGKLQNNLEELVAEAIAPLLRLQPSERGEIRLDVFVCANCGERRAVEAAIELIETTTEQLRRDYETVFPAHRVGLERGVRVFPVFIAPHGRESTRPRDEALRHVLEFELRLASEIERESLVDRIFVLDALTSRGVAPVSSLVTQVETFLGVVTDPEFRSDSTVLSCLDRPCSGRLASFGAARFEVPIAGVGRVALSLASDELVAALGQRDPDAVYLPAPEELVPSFAILRDDAMERSIEAVEAVVGDAIRGEGFSAIEASVRLATEVEQRLAAWRAAGLTKREEASTSELAESAGDGEPRVMAFVGSLLLGGSMVAIGHFAIGLTIAASLGIGGFFMLAGLGLAFFLMRLVRSQNEEVLATMEAERHAPVANNELTPEQRLDLLTSAAANARAQGNRILAQLEGLSTFPLELEDADERPWLWMPPSLDLGTIAYRATKRYATEQELSDAFRASLPDLNAILRGNAKVENDAFHAFVSESAALAMDPSVLGVPEFEETVRVELTRFFDSWDVGVSSFWEPSVATPDVPPKTPVRNLVFAPSELENLVEYELSGRETTVELQCCAPDRLEVAILTVDCDLSPGSMATFSPFELESQDE